MGAVAGGAMGFVGAPFTLGLSVPICAVFGSGVGACVGTTTGASAGLVIGGAAGYGAQQYRTKASTMRLLALEDLQLDEEGLKKVQEEEEEVSWLSKGRR